MVAAAIVGAGVIGAAGSVAAGAQQSGAANSATNAQLTMFNKTQQNLMPYINAGTGVLPQIQNLLGLGPQGSSGALSTLQNYPGYQFAFNQGLQATNQSLAAEGLIGSGQQLSALTQYGQGMADQLVNQYYGQLSGVAGLGANAAAGLGQQATATGQGVANTTVQGGAATASGIAGAANNIGSSLLSSALLGAGGSYGATGGYQPGTTGYYNYMAGNYGAAGSNPEVLAVTSDRRAKTNIKKIGRLDSGLPVYSYRYKGSALPQIGVIAQDVEKVAPHAVVRDPYTGYKRVRLDEVARLEPKRSLLPAIDETRKAA